MNELETTQAATSHGAVDSLNHLVAFCGDRDTIDVPIVDETWSPTSCLEVLGPPPFARSGFPFIGFLATVYDHVAEEMGSGRSASSG